MVAVKVLRDPDEIPAATPQKRSQARAVRTGKNPRTGPTIKIKSKARRSEFLDPADFLGVYKASQSQRVLVIKEGISAVFLMNTIRQMGLPQERLLAWLEIPKATVARKVAQQGALSKESSERVLGLAKLIGQVESMVSESGNPEGFDAPKWVGNWLQQPIPALGNVPPAEYMDTVEGQELIANTLARMQSGAYS